MWPKNLTLWQPLNSRAYEHSQGCRIFAIHQLYNATVTITLGQAVACAVAFASPSLWNLLEVLPVKLASLTHQSPEKAQSNPTINKQLY